MRRILVFTLLLYPAAASTETAAEALGTAREEIKIARGDFRRLPRIERDAIKDARAATAATAKGRSLAPAFAVAADQLEGVRGQAREIAAVLGEVAECYRQMAAELDKEIAPEAKEKVADLLKAAAEEKDGDDAGRAWRLIKRGDPRYRALAYNMKEIKAALGSLDEQQGAVGEALMNVARINEALAPLFEGVETERPAPPAAACPT